MSDLLKPLENKVTIDEFENEINSFLNNISNIDILDIASSTHTENGTDLILDLNLVLKFLLSELNNSTDYFVSTEGNDSNDGLSSENPFLTFEKFINTVSPGDTIEFTAGNYPISYSGEVKPKIFNDLNIKGVDGRVVLDSRSSISESWTLVNGTTWKTNIVHRTPTTNNGARSNTNNYSLWEGEELINWLSPKDNTISENIALVNATPNSFTVHQTDSEISDPRFDTNDVDYTYYVNLADGTNPNDANIKVTDLSSNGKFIGGHYSDLVLYGAGRKDNIHTNISPEGEIPTFKDSWWKDSAEHGSVGPMNIEGTHKVTGRTFIGDPKFEKLGRSLSGINLYTPTFYPDVELSMENLQIENTHNALYGHGSGNQGYKSLEIDFFEAQNVGSAIKFNVADRTSKKPFITDDVTIHRVEFQDVDEAFHVDGDWAVNGGSIELSDSDNLMNPNMSKLVAFTGTEPSLTLKDVEFSFEMTPRVGRQALLATRGSDGSHTTPILILDNSHDVSPTPQHKGKLARRGDESFASKIDIRLINGSTVGSLIDKPFGTNFPAALTVEAGSTFGLGDRTGQQIIDDLSAAGVPYDISRDTTIVDLAGNILDNPGW